MGRKRKRLPVRSQRGMRKVLDELRGLMDAPRWRELRRRLGEPPKLNAELQQQLRKATELESVRMVDELLLGLLKDREDASAPTKQKGRAGRPRRLTAEQIAAGIRLLKDRPGLQAKASYDLLRRELVTSASDSALWRGIVSKARQNSRT
jgi:hypothetical protein